MRQYETGFVLSPTLSEEETTQFIQQMAAIVAQKKGRLVRQDVWGKRRLAYTIRKFSEGVYVFLTYEG
ncbi:MAG: 30S ribosomal protein S6, partial [Candidatus Aminicenantales bacterium]